MTATWNLPNVLTGLRLAAVPGLGAVLVYQGTDRNRWWLGLGLFVAASVTDVVDGWVARRRDQCTPFGAFLDPIADKALVATALVCLSWIGRVPWWVTGVVLGREVAVTALRLTVLRHGLIPASRGGKVKTVTQTALVVLALAVPHWTAALTVVAWAAVLATVLTGLDYALKAAVLARTSGEPVRVPVAGSGRPLP